MRDGDLFGATAAARQRAVAAVGGEAEVGLLERRRRGAPELPIYLRKLDSVLEQLQQYFSANELYFSLTTNKHKPNFSVFNSTFRLLESTAEVVRANRAAGCV